MYDDEQTHIAESEVPWHVCVGDMHGECLNVPRYVKNAQSE